MKYEMVGGKLVLLTKPRPEEDGGGAGGGGGGGGAGGGFPMQNAAQTAPFLRERPRVFTDMVGPIDLKAATKGSRNLDTLVIPWTSIKTYDTRDFSEGTIRAQSMVKLSEAATLGLIANYVHAEIRIIGHTTAESFLMTFSSIVKRVDRASEELSTGIFSYKIPKNRFPDSIEIQAREKRLITGNPEYGDDPTSEDENLFTAWVKFSR